MAISGAQAELIYSDGIYNDGFEGSDIPVIPASQDPTSSRRTAIPVGTSAADQGFYQYLPPGYGGGEQAGCALGDCPFGRFTETVTVPLMSQVPPTPSIR